MRVHQVSCASVLLLLFIGDWVGYIYAKILLHAGEAFWRQQGFQQASQAASSVLNRLADQFPALASALLASEQPQMDDVRVGDSPVSRLLVSLTNQTMHLRPPDALAQLPHLFFIPVLWER